MEVLQIDVGGKLAHFRKYYANNTAMSFSIPPRTTLMGMLAGMLGRPRDSYYDELASERIRIGVRVMQPIKKTFHRLNLLKIVGKGDFDGSNGRIQTPFEIVSGLSISRDTVVYRVYIAAHEGGNDTFQALKQVLLNREFQYALTFGTANFTASLLSATLITDTELIDLNEWVLVHSAMPSMPLTNWILTDCERRIRYSQSKKNYFPAILWETSTANSGVWIGCCFQLQHRP